MPVCNNCNLAFEGKYCSHCGQKASVGRLSLHEIIHDAVHAVTHAEKGIVRLAKELLFSPHRLYTAYFSGKRKTYFNPVSFFLILIGLALFFGDKLIRYEGAVSGRNIQLEVSLFSLQKIRYLVFIPLISLLTWAFFHKRFNLAECFTFWFLCMGMVVLVELISYAIQFCFIRNWYPIQYYTDWLVFILILVHLFAVFPGRKFVNWLVCVLIGLSTYFLLVYIYKFLGHLKGVKTDFNFWHIIQQVFS